MQWGYVSQEQNQTFMLSGVGGRQRGLSIKRSCFNCCLRFECSNRKLVAGGIYSTGNANKRIGVINGYNKENCNLHFLSRNANIIKSGLLELPGKTCNPVISVMDKQVMEQPKPTEEKSNGTEKNN